MKINLLLVDDHAVVLKGLGFFLNMQADLEVVGFARSGEEALRLAAELKPQLVLLDLLMQGMNGIETTERLIEQQPELKILILTSFAEHDHVLACLQAGAVGYLLKDMEPDQLVEAIRGAYHGNVQLNPSIAKLLVAGKAGSPAAGSAPADAPPPQTGAETLTQRELEVLVLIASGQSNKEIAATLVIAEKTVKTHVSSILGKLGLDDRTQAALFAVKHGYVQA
ncbi:response regulator [Paenibacillus sp. HJGM_3]|uniref:response regulator n=1 Tax=Paenibacillus sp. HJGM_3 TaxID=3379816 RepID=UPI00385D3FA3